MKRLLPNAAVGSLAGFALGVLTHTGLAILGPWPAGYLALVLGALGAVVGGAVGAPHDSPSRWARSVARWCVGTAAAVGGVGFLAGFVGPILLRPDSPQGPLLGIFVTGPLGAVGGAVLGAAVGTLVPVRPRGSGPHVPAAAPLPRPG